VETIAKCPTGTSVVATYVCNALTHGSAFLDGGVSSCLHQRRVARPFCSRTTFHSMHSNACLLAAPSIIRARPKCTHGCLRIRSKANIHSHAGNAAFTRRAHLQSHALCGKVSVHVAVPSSEPASLHSDSTSFVFWRPSAESQKFRQTLGSFCVCRVW
jgi:hypothetical protein